MKFSTLLVFSLAVAFCIACSESPEQVLGQDTAVLRGTVSVSGVPRSGYTVVAGDRTTVTGVAGDYEFSDVPTGYQEFAVLHNEYSCRSVYIQVVSPETVKDVNLEDPARICDDLPPGTLCTFYPGPNYEEWLDSCL